MKKFGSLFAALVLSVVVSATADAQKFGAHAIWANDAEIGVGARYEHSLANKLSKTGPLSKAFFIGQFDWFLDACDPADCTYFEINPGIAVPLNATNLKPYVGGGLNIAVVSADCPAGFDCSSNDVGLNVLGGLKLNLSGLDAFTEARLSLGGGEQLAVMFGILFGGNSSASKAPTRR